MKEKAAYKKILILAGMFLLLITGLCMKPYTVKADTATFRTAGKTYYMETGKTQTLLYLKNGNRYRLVAENKQGFMKYKFVYGKKLYFVAGGEGKPCVTYSYTEGKSGFQKGEPCISCHTVENMQSAIPAWQGIRSHLPCACSIFHPAN